MGSGPQASLGSGTSVTKAPGYVRKPLKRLLKHQEQNLWDPETGELIDYPFPDLEVAPFQPLQEAGFQAIEDLGAQSPLIDTAVQQQQEFLSQDAINNPLLSQYFNMAGVDVLSNMNAGALRSGGFGSSANQEELGRALSNLATSIYYPAWAEQERLKQTSAMGAPQLAQGQYIPAQALLAAGTTQQEQEQNEINARIQNEWERTGWPFKATELMALPIQLGFGGGSSTSYNQRSYGFG